MSALYTESKRISGEFQQASKVKSRGKRVKAPPPFSLRLTHDERAYLNRQAGGKPLAAYIRERLLKNRAEKRKFHRKPKIDEKQIALVLAELGSSRLSSNLNQIAKAANTGTLDLSRDVEQELLEACAAISTMRDTLISALGLKPESGQ